MATGAVVVELVADVEEVVDFFLCSDLWTTGVPSGASAVLPDADDEASSAA